MPESTLDSVRQRFEREAESFDAIYRLERSLWSRWFNRVFRKAIFERYELAFSEAGEIQGKNVLDIGCGSGVYAVDFARRGARRVLGVDFSGNMIRLAKAEAEQHGVSGICQFLQANFLELSIAERFDVSIAMGVFDYLPDPVVFLKKMASVTDGKVILSLPGHSPIRERLRKLRYRLAGKGAVYFFSEQDVKQLAERAELRDVAIKHIHSSGTGFVLTGRGAPS